MTDIFNKLNEQLKSGYPFAVYCKPGDAVVCGVFQVNAEDYLPHGGGFIFAPFDEGIVCFIPSDAADVIVVPLPRFSSGLPEAPQPSILADAKASFETLVTKSITAIREGKFEKLVVSRSEVVETDSTVTEMFMKLLQAYPMAYRYCFYHPVSGLWMGATPEQLLKSESNIFHTVALAGTQVYKDKQEVVWQDKEKQEQKFVTDYIVSSLQRKVTSVSTSKPYTFRAGNLVHIKTDISAELQDNETVGSIIEALHPTPAVCGLPKEEAKSFLIQNEGYDRAYYSGYLGEMHYDFAKGNQMTDIYVNLRCMQLKDGSATLYIGCGITRDSNPEKEFIETVNKSMTMRRVLAE